MTKVTGHTSLYALFGYPVEHSKSPEMYNYCFNKMDTDSVYVTLEAREDDFENAFNAVRSTDIKGGNLTMPVKTLGAKYADELTDSARLIGAVNCFRNDKGKIYGHNTDGKGFIDNLLNNGHEVKDKKMVLIGTGAAATAIACQAIIDGVHELAIFNQKDKFYENGEKTVEKLTKEFPDRVITMNDLADEDLLKEKIAAADILTNATKVGMEPNEDQSLVKPEYFHKDLIVTDTVYSPLETKLIKEAQAAGVKATYGGIGMLLYQGAAGFNFMTGQDMPVEDVKRDVYGL